MDFIDTLSNLDIPNAFMEACVTGFNAIFEPPMRQKKTEKLEIPATYSGHTLTLRDGTLIEGFPIGIRGTTEVMVDGCDKGRFEFIPWTFGGETPKPMYYKYKITSHTPEGSPNKYVKNVHFTDDPTTEVLLAIFHDSHEPPFESVKFVKGHKDSKGEEAPWTIVSHETGKILSSHKSKKAAEEHLRQMEYFKHKG